MKKAPAFVMKADALQVILISWCTAGSYSRPPYTCFWAAI